MAYVEYNILLQHLQEIYPDHTRAWNTQVRQGQGPTEPVQEAAADLRTTQMFNQLICSGACGSLRAPSEQPPAGSWASSVLHDIQRFHRQGYMVGGLTAATLRRHEKLWTGASSDMGIQTAACSQLAFWNLHDLTTAVPPPNSDRWASLQEIQLWALSHTIKNHDRLPGPGWTSWGSWLGRAGRLLGLTAASSSHLVVPLGSRQWKRWREGC